MFDKGQPTSNLKVGTTVIVWSETVLYQPTEFKTGCIESESKESWFVSIKGEVYEFNKETLTLV